MNTQTNKTIAETLAQTAIATLLRFKPSMKIDESLTASIVDDLQAVIPAPHDNKLTEATRAMLPSLKAGMFDTMSDDIVIKWEAFYKADKSEQTDIHVPAGSVTFKLPSYDVETVRFFALALQGLQKQPDYTASLGKKHNNNAKLTALVDFIIPVLQGADVVTQAAKAESLSESFDFASHGLDSKMFATGNKSVYTMPKNGGIKLYLLAEYKREFDDLADAGLLSEEYGRNLVKEGDFTGCYAVVVPIKVEGTSIDVDFSF